ncbi:MAG: SAM-dependent methyltransferase [Acidimicrobiales bacterium]
MKNAAQDLARFEKRYATSGTDALIDAEREVLGSDYRANGYTTVEQADALASDLHLRPESTLIDIGSGCGWPGLYMAAEHGCTLVSIDPVQEGSEAARERSISDGTSDRCWQARAAAQYLPLRTSSIDAIVHTDLLC